MKPNHYALISCLLLTTLSSAFAGRLPTESNTWSEILNNYKHTVKVEFPRVRLDNAGRADINEVCYDGEILKTINKITECTDYRYISRERVCVARKTFTGVAKLSGSRLQCAYWDNRSRGERSCKKWEDVPYNYELSNKVKVYSKRLAGHAEYRYKLIFEKEYTIPNCQ